MGKNIVDEYGDCQNKKAVSVFIEPSQHYWLTRLAEINLNSD